MKYICRTYIKAFMNQIWAGAFLKIMGSGFELIIPLVLAQIIDNVLPGKDVKALLFFGGFLIIITAIGLVSNLKANRISTDVGCKIVGQMRTDLMDQILEKSYEHKGENSTASLVNRLTIDTNSIYQMVVRLQKIGVRVPLMLIGAIVTLIAMDLKIAAIVLLMIPVTFAGTIFLTKLSYGHYKSLNRKKDRLIDALKSSISGIRVIKAYGNEEIERLKFEAVNNEILYGEIKVKRIVNLIEPYSNLVLAIGQITLLIAGAYFIKMGTTQIGTLIASITYYTMIFNALASISKINDIISQAYASADRLTEIFTWQSLSFQYTEAMVFKQCICFENVSFSYRGKEPTLKQLTFTLVKGMKLGIVGETGSGKSTIVPLLTGLLKDYEGSILMDGTDMKFIDPKAIRNNFGVTMQQNFLFNDNLRNNICLGKDISDEELALAIYVAAIEDFVEEGQDVLQYMIQGNGENLSGGQKQRIQIARALVARPPILILDDIFASLDYQTDLEIRKRIEAFYGDITLIMISQKIMPVKDFDLLLVMNNGIIEASGKHIALIQSSVLYKKMWDSEIGEDL